MTKSSEKGCPESAPAEITHQTTSLFHRFNKWLASHPLAQIAIGSIFSVVLLIVALLSIVHIDPELAKKIVETHDHVTSNFVIAMEEVAEEENITDREQDIVSDTKPVDTETSPAMTPPTRRRSVPTQTRRLEQLKPQERILFGVYYLQGNDASNNIAIKIKTILQNNGFNAELRPKPLSFYRRDDGSGGFVLSRISGYEVRFDSEEEMNLAVEAGKVIAEGLRINVRIMGVSNDPYRPTRNFISVFHPVVNYTGNYNYDVNIPDTALPPPLLPPAMRVNHGEFRDTWGIRAIRGNDT